MSSYNKQPIKAEALRQAQLAMLQGQSRDQGRRWPTAIDSGNKYRVRLPSALQTSDRVTLSHPYFWSGFTLIGNPW